MAVKLATLVAVFSLLLSSAAFASPVELDMGGEAEAFAGEAVDRADLVGEHEQAEEEVELYLGPTDEIITGIEDKRAN